MRRILLSVAIAAISLPLLAQPSGRRPLRRINGPAHYFAADSAVKQAMEQLAELKKTYDRDLAVLRHLRAAEEALADSMQPNNAIQKAYEEIGAAKALMPDPTVMFGIRKVEEQLESARLSPASADFSRLRSTVINDAVEPATQLVARNGASLQEELLSWLKVQESITLYLRTLSEISGESLRAATQ